MYCRWIRVAVKQQWLCSSDKAGFGNSEYSACSILSSFYAYRQSLSLYGNEQIWHSAKCPILCFGITVNCTKSISCSIVSLLYTSIFLLLPFILSTSCHSSITHPWRCWSEWVNWCSWRGECLSSQCWSFHLLLLFPLLPHPPLHCPKCCSQTDIQKCSAG